MSLSKTVLNYINRIAINIACKDVKFKVDVYLHGGNKPRARGKVGPRPLIYAIVLSISISPPPAYLSVLNSACSSFNDALCISMTGPYTIMSLIIAVAGKTFSQSSLSN